MEPENSVVPRLKWRLYPFKNDQPLEPYKVHRKSWYLLGRDRHVCDIPLDHPSCSKQHAVLQYRLVRYEVRVVWHATRGLAHTARMKRPARVYRRFART